MRLIKLFRAVLLLFVTSAILAVASAVAHGDERKRLFDATEGFDFKQKFDFLLPLAESGNSEAQYLVGNQLYRGQGVEENIDESTRWIMKSANQGHADALYHLGTQYRHGIGVQKNVSTMLELWEKAAAQGSSWALTDIGTIYFKGELVKQDSDRAIRFWEAAVEQNHPVAKYQLGVILRDGNTVSQDHTRAIKLFSEAAEQIPIAAYNTGSMIFHGMGVPKSQKLAYAWFKIAKLSNAAAKENGTFLAATYGAPQASKALAELSKMISQSEVQLGDRLFEHCFKKSFRGCLSLCTSFDEENCAMLK